MKVFQNRQNRRHRRGLTLIEAALTIGIAAIVLAGLSQILVNAAETTRARTTAERLSIVTRAAEEYVTAYYPQLRSGLSSGGAPMEVPVSGSGPAAIPGLPSLQGGGFLPSTFQNVNGYGQNHAVILRRVPGADERIEGIVLTEGGSTIEDPQLGRIATFIGADGGFIRNEPIAGTEGLITGVAGGWRTPASTWSVGGVTPSAGRLMTALAFNQGALTGDYLYRRDIGIPEANTMRTHLNMAGNNIDDLHRINASAAALQVGPALEVDDYVTAGTDITAGRNLTVGDNATIGNDLTVGRDISSGRNISATNNLYGKRFFDLDNTSYYVDPASTSNINILDVNRISGNARVYQTGTSGTLLEGTLADRLPNYVTKAAYVVGNGTTVAKPTCGSGGDPKITFMPMIDGYQFASNVFYENTNVKDHVPPLINDVIRLGRQYYAQNSGSNWIMRFAGNPSPYGYRGLVMTHCYYAP